MKTQSTATSPIGSNSSIGPDIINHTHQCKIRYKPLIILISLNIHLGDLIKTGIWDTFQHLHTLYINQLPMLTLFFAINKIICLAIPSSPTEDYFPHRQHLFPSGKYYNLQPEILQTREGQCFSYDANKKQNQQKLKDGNSSCAIVRSMKHEFVTKL